LFYFSAVRVKEMPKKSKRRVKQIDTKTPKEWKVLNAIGMRDNSLIPFTPALNFEK
jgi:hypothetical protein